jgi:hypothetical protein
MVFASPQMGVCPAVLCDVLDMQKQYKAIIAMQQENENKSQGVKSAHGSACE